MEEIKAKIKQLKGVENACKLPMDMKIFLLAKAQTWRDQKHTAPRGNTRAVVQDARCTLERVSDEVRQARISSK
jgi:copper chaperone CopZ